MVEDLHSHGIEVNPYTVDDPADIRDMIAKGVHSVITNCPDVVNRIRSQLSHRPLLFTEKDTHGVSFFWCARRDSNPRPTGS